MHTMSCGMIKTTEGKWIVQYIWIIKLVNSLGENRCLSHNITRINKCQKQCSKGLETMNSVKSKENTNTTQLI